MDRRDNLSTTLAELGLIGHKSGGLLATDEVVVNLMASALRLLCLRLPRVLLLTPSSTLSITMGMVTPSFGGSAVVFPISCQV